MRYLSTLAIVIWTLGVGVGSQASEQAEDMPAKVKASKPKKEVAKTVTPNFELGFRDANQLTQFFQKNQWFQEMRASPFYQGALHSVNPLLFSLAEDYGPNAKTWTGRLLDALYEEVLKGKPLVYSYYNQARWVAPWVITVSGIGPKEKKFLDTLVKSFRSLEDQEIKTIGEKTVKVTPLIMRNQKYALRFLDAGKEHCVVLGKDPQLLAEINKCSLPLAKTDDALFKVNLKKQFPAISSLREKFLKVGEELRFPMKWDTQTARYDIVNGLAVVSAKSSAFRKAKVAPGFLSALPANTIFFASSFLPSIKNFKADEVQNYLKPFRSESNVQAIPQEVAFFYSPYWNEKKGLSIGAGLLIRYPGAEKRGALEELTEIFPPRGETELGILQVCKDYILISPTLALVHNIEEVCKGKQASLANGVKTVAARLAQTEIVGSLYFAPGTMMASLMQVGWTKGGRLAPEVLASQKMVQSLPDYFFSVSMNKMDQLILKRE